MSNKTLRSIQFVPGRVILDYGENKVFQLCKKCQNGGHIKAFLNHFCPEVNLQVLDATQAIQLERRFYNRLSRGAARRIVNREGYLFGEYAQRRCALIEKRRNRAEQTLEN